MSIVQGRVFGLISIRKVPINMSESQSLRWCYYFKAVDGIA